ncbi:hypothetical protein GGU10DRAFT_425194 [Lentinula aff. detonsa]|uniref:Clavaminate synthase-like protein n=1 Tax=Lentinula aff. detonsa TaxID=2804958 RepID=A0AA38U6U4_9AGAR|nr:hypothetical protein GGU10DRAFT_425194 [Lentinula aff. detonsa]
MSLIHSAAIAQSSFQTIPIINLSQISSNDPSIRRALAMEIRSACINVGFFYVANHGVPETLTEEFVSRSKEFFALPLESKLKESWKILLGNNDPEGGGDFQEGFEFTGEPFDSLDQTEIPESNFPYAIVNLGKLLFPIFALALDLKEDYFDQKTNNAAALMRSLRYPPQEELTDEHCFTILWQEPGIQALQVLNSDKEWIDAPPIPGDQFARWTNGIFKSTVHRAINRSNVYRYSIPLFMGANWDAKLEPIPGCVSPDRPLQYEVITAGEYVKVKLADTYKQHR